MLESILILDYEDWSVYYDNESATFIYVDNDTKEWFYVRPIATLHYTIFEQPNDTICLDTLFDNTCCGEQVTDDEIIYWWFKEIEE